jgi:D-methionine transport system ATP-binding protein
MPGQITGIIGRSGSGKSTLLRILGGLREPDKGTIALFGKNLWQCPLGECRQLLRKIGTIFQELNLLSRRTVAENIALPLEFMGLPARERLEKAAAVAEWVGIGHLLDRYPSQLSGGEKQRVAIARALSPDAKVLLCDELTSALDHETTLEILGLLQEINERLGVTVILITHDISVVREICDRVCVIEQGTVVEEGSIERILLSPQHPATQALLGHITMQEIPQHWLEIMQPQSFEGAQAVLQIIFVGDLAHRPLIADLILACNVSVSIVAGHIDHVRRTAFGNIIITVPVNNGQCEKTLAYLQGRHAGAEILGYLPL